MADGATDTFSAPRKHRSLGRVLRRAITILLLLTLAAATSVGLYLDVSFHVAPESTTAARGGGALWAGHAWVGDLHPPAAYATLAGELQENRITDLFVHVGPLNGAGLIPPSRFTHAGDLIAALRGADPALRVQAWIGQVLTWAGGPLDLADPRVRDNIVRTAASFLALGFRGIHYDIEPVRSGDPDFLALLAQTRALTRRSRAVLSVAADPLDPLGEAAETLHALAPRYPTWTADYYHQVAARVDQIAVMTYGSAFPTPALYGSFVRMETAALLRSVDPGVRLFVGIPTYDVVGWGFLHHAETLSAAVRGIREGVVGFSTRRVDDLSGAIYADWTTTGADWRAYERAWLRPGAASL